MTNEDGEDRALPRPFFKSYDSLRIGGNIPVLATDWRELSCVNSRTGRYSMGIQIAAVGATRQQELPQDRGSARSAQIRTAERAAVLDKFEASLPGNREPHHLEAITADLERISLAFNRKLQFVVDHRSNEVIVKVIDPETDKVIKVLPPEELQRMHNKLKETIGFLFDEKV
jgi:flagellar protein FlaG